MSLRDTEGRRPAATTVPWASKYKKIFEYWNSFDSEAEVEDEKEEVKPEVVVKPVVDPILKIQGIRLNLLDNSSAHNTSEYEVIITKKVLIVRRGQSFDIDIDFNREYKKGKDDLRFIFQFGASPNIQKKTHAEFVLSDKDLKREWGASIRSQSGNSIKVGFISPPDCMVGKWTFKAYVVREEAETVTIKGYKHKDPIYILFNPWCKDDMVYMHDKELLKEYVLNEMGRLYIGSYSSISSRGWDFGQFGGNILDCALYLLEAKSELADHVRGNPIAVVRKISQLVNSQDDKGVLVGNWSESYEGGKSPSFWSGSGKILEQYYETKEPVKFGQCWVYSGVFTTVCRAIGIPIRSVTNFVSAHDTDGTLRVEWYYDENGEEMENFETDSIWNFHVWNDAWMARPDLPPGYGGWQAVDATPQETSGGVYCMGPMSLKAVKNGELFMPYDGPFVYAEVNADVCCWTFAENDLKLGDVYKNHVGRFISTKEPFTSFREDVTNQYKFEEGSKEERAALLLANQESSSVDYYNTDIGPKDVNAELKLNTDTFMGDTIIIEVVFTNTSEELRKLSGTLKVSSMYYTGVHHKVIAKEKVEAMSLTAGKSETLRLTIEESQYLSLLMDHCILGLSGLFLVDKTNQACNIKDELRLRKPHLSFKAATSGQIGKTVPVEVTFKNPLSVTLTGCELTVEGAGLVEPLVQEYGDVPAKTEFVGKFEITPKKVGKREITAVFTSKQIRNVNASHEILVE